MMMMMSESGSIKVAGKRERVESGSKWWWRREQKEKFENDDDDDDEYEGGDNPFVGRAN